MSDHAGTKTSSPFADHVLPIVYLLALGSGAAQFFGLIADPTSFANQLAIPANLAFAISGVLILGWIVTVAQAFSKGRTTGLFAVVSLPLAIPFFLLWAWFAVGILLTGQAL